MFGNTSPEDEALNKAISENFSALSGLEEGTPAHSIAVDQIVKLVKLKKEINPSWRPSPDAIIGVLGTIATAIIVLKYEKLGNIITTKAFGFVGRMLK